MRRSFVLICLGLVFLLSQAATDALGRHPDFLRNYRFLPRHSILNVTGGFAGFDIGANLFGKYGMVTGFGRSDPSIDPIPPSLHPFANFVDVRAVAINPADFGPYSWGLDETLNLSGLKGRPLPIYFPAVLPNIAVYQFEGTDGQGAPMKVQALTVGRWMFMRGANDPTTCNDGAACSDLFGYEFKSLARQGAFADVNDDDLVDGRDLAQILSSFGSPDVNALGLEANGDTDADGDSDGGDFLAWQRLYGETVPLEDFDAMLTDILAVSSATASAVPEPSSLLLVGFVLLVGIASRGGPAVLQRSTRTSSRSETSPTPAVQAKPPGSTPKQSSGRNRTPSTRRVCMSDIKKRIAGVNPRLKRC